MYHVVESQETHGRSCFVIPNNWMIHERGVCYWPPGPGVESKVKSKKTVDPRTWSLYPAKILKTTDNYDDARRWLLVAEYQSDLNTDAEDESTPKRPKQTQPRRLRTHRNKAVGSDIFSDDEDFNERESGSVLPSPPAPVSFVLVDHGDANTGSVNRNVMEDSNFLISACMESQQSTTGADELSSNAVSSGSSAAFPLNTPDTNSNLQTFQRIVQVDSADNTEILLKIAEDISVIKQTVLNVEQRLDHLEREVRAGRFELASQGQTKVIQQRFSTLEDFTKFDSELTQEDLRLMRVEMQECGGDSVVEFVGRVMRKVMTDQLATKFSLWGHKNNQNFSVTQTWTTLKAAALAIRKLNPDERALEKAGMNWFRHASDRLRTAKTQGT